MRFVGNYRIEATSAPAVVKIIDEKGRWVGEIRHIQVAEASGEHWDVYLGPGRASPPSYESAEAAFQAIVTHAEADPGSSVE